MRISGAKGISGKVVNQERQVRERRGATMLASQCLWLALLMQLAVNGAAGLTGVRIIVPEAVAVGDTARLACDYDLEQAALYSIKWYRGEHEFYSFVPKEDPPTRVFPLEGVKVDVSRSNEHQVTLTNVGRDLTGYFKCEVSADAPLFHTDIKSALMIVADLPRDGPVVDVEKLKYSLGEKIRANCSVEPSYPPANITWYINSKLLSAGASGARIETTTSLVDPLGMLEAARSSLEVEASAPFFVEGRMGLRCLATVFTLYRRTEELTLAEDTPQLAPVMGPTAPHSLGDVASKAQELASAAGVLSAALVAVFASR